MSPHFTYLSTTTTVVHRPCCPRGWAREIFARTSGSGSSRAPSVSSIARRSCRTFDSETAARLQFEPATEGLNRRYTRTEKRKNGHVLTGVHATVILHVVPQLEGLSAELALEGPVAGVHRQVRDERGDVGEALTTEFAQHHAAAARDVAAVARAGVVAREGIGLHLHGRRVGRLERVHGHLATGKVRWRR
jgi:hypothetical protein